MKNIFKCVVVFALICVSLPGLAISLKFEVKGLKGAEMKNVINTLKNQQGLLIYPLTEAEVYRFYRLAPKEIEKALQPYGIFRPNITADMSQQKAVYTTTFTIEPGPRMLVTNLRVRISGQGEHDPAFAKLLKKFPIKLDKPLNIDQYNQAKQDLLQLATERGYFKYRVVRSHITINLKTYQASISIHVNTGPRFRIGETRIVGNPLHDTFIRKFLRYHPGEYYDYQYLEKTQEDLIKSNYFNQVVVTPEVEAAKNHVVPIKIELIPQKAKQYSFGLGYGTDTGPRGTLEVNLRRVNGYGHRLNFLAQGALKGNSNVTLNYTIPGSDPARNQYTISGGYGHIEFKNKGVENKSKSVKGSVGYITMFGRLQQTISLTYLDERYNLPALNLPFNVTSRAIYPSISWQYTRANKRLAPDYGFSAYSYVYYAPFKLNKNSDPFFQARLELRGLVTFKKNTRLLARTSFGYTDIANLSRLPLSLQLFAGGANSIRGFGYNSIGPGRNLILGSLELQQRIKGNWFIAAFIDAGNITNNANPFANGFTQSLYAGAGPALVYLSPVGSLELSVARSLNKRQKRWYVQFSMGQDL